MTECTQEGRRRPSPSEVREQEGTDQAGDQLFIDQSGRGLAGATKNKPSRVNEYRNMFYNQVFPVLGPDVPVNHLEWSNGERQQVLSLKEYIESRGLLYQSDKCLMVMRGVLDYAIDRGWMQPPNPDMGSKQAKSMHILLIKT